MDAFQAFRKLAKMVHRWDRHCICKMQQCRS